MKKRALSFRISRPRKSLVNDVDNLGSLAVAFRARVRRLALHELLLLADADVGLPTLTAHDH